MTTELLLISSLLIAFGLIILGVIYRQLGRLASGKLDEDRTKALINQVFGEMSEKIMFQAKHALENDKAAIYQDNRHQKAAIETLVEQLKKEIQERQKEIRQLEQDRNQKFGDITRALQEHRQVTDELKTSTQSLAHMLSNNQVRGQWGERIIEDILRTAGLIESVHYVKQKALAVTKTVPDITLLLPNQRLVAVDVKFPYSQVQQLVTAKTESARQQHLKLFEKDVKEKINQLDKRGYINPEAGTLDYAILFVPNEQLFSYINQEFPHLIDEAMNRKIMIVSPFTFLIVARTVMESYRNFMMENNLRSIIQHISHFIEEWERFTLEFNKFDTTIEKLRQSFDQISSTRFKQMNLRIKRIRDYQQQGVSEPKHATVLEDRAGE